MRKLLSAIGVALMIVALAMPGVVLASPAATASRDLPATVAPGAEFDVDITASDYGMMGQVLETLPAGFSYVSSSLDDSQVQVVGNVVTFLLIGDTSFTYAVTAATVEDTYTFSGIIKDEDLNEYTIGGDTAIVVSGAPPATTASRDLPDSVLPGAEFNVGITASGYGTMGQVLETLPTGFSYVSSSLDASQVLVTGNVVKFVLLGESSFTYAVTAATVEDTYTFSGIIKDEDLNEYTIGGDTAIVVSSIPEPPPEVELEFTGTLAQGETSSTLTTIPADATLLEITLSAATDLDLNLFDDATFVIGWHGEIDSSGSTTGIYEGDTFVYSGWNGGEEYINSDGPLGRAYDLKVYGFQAGDYTVTVSYVSGAPLNPPPTITITVLPTSVTLGSQVTVTVSATDADGVEKVMFTVSSPDVIQSVMSFDDEMSLTFVPGLAGTYTVEARAEDNQGNITPEANPETTTFVVSG